MDGLLVMWSHGDAWAWNAGKGHDFVCGSDAVTGVGVDVCGFLLPPRALQMPRVWI